MVETGAVGEKNSHNDFKLSEQKCSFDSVDFTIDDSTELKRELDYTHVRTQDFH